MRRVPAGGLLRVDEAAIGHDFEGAAARVDELHAGVGVPLPDGGRQTDGSGTIVSDDAVFDRDVHGFFPLHGSGRSDELGSRMSPPIMYMLSHIFSRAERENKG